MTTIKLKKPPAASPRADGRSPLRPTGVKRARPTLAQAQAERAERRGPWDEPPTPADARGPRQSPDARGPRQSPDARGPRRSPDARGPRRSPDERGPRREPEARAPRHGPDERPAPPDARRRAAAPSERKAPASTDRRPAPYADRRPPAPTSDRRPAPARDRDRDRAPTAPPIRRAAPPRTEPLPTTPTELPRLSKRMSELGLASRREADEWIARGLVRVDGVIVDQLGARVSPAQRIEVDPEAHNEQSQRVTILLHKPLGIVSGQAEDGHAPAVTLIGAASRWPGDHHRLQFHPSQLHHLVPAGRLDLDSTGLLVLTQDGRVAKQLIGADTKVEKEYVVHVAWAELPEGATLSVAFPAEKIALLRHGIEIDKQALQPAKVSWQNEQHLRIVLREGKRRQIRRMCEAVGLQVLGLKRIRIGRIGLGEMAPGQWRYLGPFESFL